MAGACSTLEKADALRSAGVDAHLWRPDDGQALDAEGVAALTRAACVLSSVPPVGDYGRDPVLLSHGADLIAACAGDTSHLRWAGYLSSTSVYGDYDGQWVDETSELRIDERRHAKAWARALAERAWLQLHRQYGVPTHIFRLGGIYGPGRSLLDSARRTRPVGGSVDRARHEKRYISRCHVEDIVSVLLTSMAKPRAGCAILLS